MQGIQLKPEDLNDTPAAKKEFSVKFELEIYGTQYGLLMRPIWEPYPIYADSPELLESQLKALDTLKYDVEKLSFTLNADLLSHDVKNKFGDILLKFAEKSFTITKLKIADDIIGPKTQAKINALLERNRQFSLRKLKIASASVFIGILVGLLSLGSLPTLLLGVALACPTFWLINQRCNQHDGQNGARLHLNLALIILGAAFLTTLCFGMAGYIPLLVGVGGLMLNALRDREIKHAITTYIAPDKQLQDNERDSFDHGLAAQKSFIPAFHWNLSTWKCPRPYYASYYSPEFVVEEKSNNSKPKPM